MLSGFPRGIEKVLNYNINFQDLEKVLKLAKISKICIGIEKVWKF